MIIVPAWFHVYSIEAGDSTVYKQSVNYSVGILLATLKGMIPLKKLMVGLISLFFIITPYSAKPVRAVEPVTAFACITVLSLLSAFVFGKTMLRGKPPKDDSNSSDDENPK